MKTWVHLLVSSVLAALLYPLFGWNVLLILAGGVLIDVDHYFWYVSKYKKFNLFYCYSYFMARMNQKGFKEHKGILLIFHTIEFLLIIVLLSFYFEAAFIFLVGLLSHYLLDAIFLYTVAKRLITNHSIINWIIKNKPYTRSRKIQKV